MLVSKNIQVYVKTTDTCNLNCSHCFTSGSKGKKIFFNPENTINFLKKLIVDFKIESINILYFGGEPMIAPLDDLYKFHNLAKKLPTETNFGIQTNLVYKLTKEKQDFFNYAFKTGIGTSWDPDIRFGSSNYKSKKTQEILWENNVKQLIKNGHQLTLIVSLSKYLIENYEPKSILKYAIALGFTYIQFERITLDGNVNLNTNIFPSNQHLDNWLFKMYHQTISNSYEKKIKNMFINEIVNSILKKSHIGNRCRGCEQSIITINADGSLSGCPNSAISQNWGHITAPVNTFTKSPLRINAICQEKQRHYECLTCEVNHICNGDCYKLKWEEDRCPAPISLMRELNNQTNINRDLLI